MAVKGAAESWLNNASASLGRLAADERMGAGAILPSGVESLPIQRVLYEFSYLTRKPEVYVFDLLRNRVGKTAGASNLDDNIMDVLSDIDDDQPHMLVGMGMRNGQILLLRKVNAPLPLKLYVGIPVDPSALGNTMPVLPAKYKRTVGLAIAHTRGWMAWDGGTTFTENESLASAVSSKNAYAVRPSSMTTLTPLDGWAGAVLTVEGPAAISGTRILPHLLVLLWALCMSALVLFHGTQASQRMKSALLPLVGPFEDMLAQTGRAAGNFFSGFISEWKRANDDSPLVSGPGGFDQTDFISPERTAALNGGKRRPLPQERKGSLKATEFANVERRAKRRGKDKTD
ncbi:MAG: hypothetical protein DI585_06070, partial [Pseudomonas fluorescens]